MVMEYGISELGPINLSVEDRRMPYEAPNISPDMAAKIDTQVKRLTDEGYHSALTILKKLRKKLDILAKELLIKETIESEEFARIIGPKKVALAILKV